MPKDTSPNAFLPGENGMGGEDFITKDKMPKDTVEEAMKEIRNIQPAHPLVYERIEQLLTTAYNKGIEVGSKSKLEKNRYSLTSQYNPLLNQDMIISALHATMKRVDALDALTPLPEVSL